jgi:hypothetical protein
MTAHDDNTSNHSQTVVVDASSTAVKSWCFDNST